MATATIPNGEEHFFPIIYEGNGAGQRVGKFVPFTDNGTIANSVIFNDADNAYLQRTNDAGDRDTFTISVWVKRCALGSVQYILDTYDGSSTNDGLIRFNTDNTMSIRLGSPSNLLYITNRTFEDTSKFYHIMLSVNTGESTAADRAKLYVDGDRITSFSTQTTSGSVNTQFNYSSATFRIGSTTSGNYDFDGYLAEFNQVDGTALTPDTFGLTDTSTGRWIPKALTGITYGTNGFRLQFGSPSAIGDDTSGNTNDFSVSNLVAGDQTTDSPTQNFPTIDSSRSSLTLSEGNTVGQGSPSIKFGFSGMTFDPSDTTGYYLEFKVLSANGGVIGFRSDTDPLPISTTASYVGDGYLAMNYANGLYLDGTSIYSGSGTWTTNDIIGFYIKENKLYYSVNGTMQNSSNHVGVFSKPGRYRITMGHNSSVGSAKFQMFCPQSKWTYTPSGDFANYREINQDNAPETAKGVSGLVWAKSRDETRSHALYDSSRGAENYLASNSTGAESSTPSGLHKFLKGGFQTGENATLNNSGASYVSWNWVANSGTSASNSDGSITSTVQANTTSGFSIVEFTTPSSTQDFTVGHGLSVAPRVFFFKRTDSTSGWAFYHQNVFDTYGNQYTLFLNTNSAAYAPNPGTAMYPSATTATTFSLRAGASIASSANCVAYCFNEVEGFSKFGKYVGNSSNDGVFVYLGFRPSFLMLKRYAGGDADWMMADSKRWSFNRGTGTSSSTNIIIPHSSGAEVTNYANIDFLSNGFKLRSSVSGNLSSGTYLYMAFAEHPFVGDGTNPVTAR